jgi:very-short-patch-repair endonuclease
VLSRFGRNPAKAKPARAPRQAATPAKRVLWSKLRSLVEGQTFRRQQPMGAYVIDFYCSALGLAIELDDGQHDHTDAARDLWLRGRGIQVLRYANSDVFSNLSGVLEEIRTVALALSAEQGGSRQP